MRILYIIHSLNVGGAETVVTRYVSKLKQMGHDVTLLELAHVDSFLYEELRNKEVNIITATPKGKSRIWNMFYTRLFLSKKVNSIIREVNPEIVHLHTYSWFVSISSIDPTRIFYTLHCTLDSFINYIPWWTRKKYVEFLKSGITIIGLSELIKASIIATTNKKDDVVVLPNGLDIKQITENKYDKSILKDYGVKNDTFVVGHIGRFNEVKNHYKLFDIFSAIKRNNEKAVLVLVGDGSAAEKKQIDNYMEQFGISDSVILLGLRKDASLIMGCFDVFILPSKSEAFPLVAIEAQANGTRSIFSDVVPDELIVNRNCFKLSIDSDSKEWAKIALSKEMHEHDGNIMDLDITNVLRKHISLYKQKANIS